MRRIISACLLQTMRFDIAKDANPDRDFEFYCHKLDKSHTKYVIESKEKEADGSLVVKVKKEYNSYKTDGYID